MVFAEAMAAGLPIVGTTAGAVPGVVPPAAGRLVPPDDPEAMAAAMVELAADPARRSRLGTVGHARAVERFGLDRMVDETLAIYADVIEAAKR